MSVGFAFAATLLVALLVSERAHRSILSGAVIFLGVGLLAGPAVIGWLSVDPAGSLVSEMSTFALFAVLFTDAMRIGVRDIRRGWHLPGRALLVGMPLTALLIAGAAHWIAGLPWILAFLAAVALSPTDPVFAAAIVGRDALPGRLRNLLNIESGVNDGIALPFLLILLGQAQHEAQSVPKLLTEILAGVAVGIAIPWLAIVIRRSRFFALHRPLEPLFLFAVGLLVLTIAAIEHVNEYLAAFAAGITVASVAPELKKEFERFGGLVAELLKLAALLLFGVLFSGAVAEGVAWPAVVFALFVLLIARPVAICLVLLGSDMTWPERLTAAWFGPKGFASVVYALLVLHRGIPGGPTVYGLIALTTAISIVLHSSTDVPIARWFARQRSGQ